MASDTTIKNRVLSILGEDNLDYLDQISAPEELWNEALWEVAGIVPSRYLLTQIEQPVAPENMTIGETTTSPPYGAEDKLLLLVLRVEADHVLADDNSTLVTERYVTKPCQPIPFEDVHKAQDVNSIHYATKFSPVFTYKNVSGSQSIYVYPEVSGSFTAGTGPYDDTNIMPQGNSAIVVFAYPRQEIMKTDGGTDPNEDLQDEQEWDKMTGFENIPRDIEDLVIKRIAMKVIELKISDMATQEEDTELFTLLNNNKTLLETSLKESIQKLNLEWA